MIAKEKKPYNIGEKFIKSCMLKTVGLELGMTFKKMTLYSTIKTPFDELAKNIECQVLKKLQAPFFQFNVIKQVILPDCRRW